MKSPVVFIAFLLLAVLASTGNAYYLRSMGPVPEVAEVAAAVVAAAAGGGGGAAVPWPLPAGAVGAVGGGAAVAGAVPAANVVVVPAAPAAVVPAAAAAGGGGVAMPAGGPDGNLPVASGWSGWATGAITGVRTFVAAHPVAVAGAVVTAATGITLHYHGEYGHQALDWAFEGKECYRKTFDDYQEVLMLIHGECTSYTDPLEWRKRAEAVVACSTGTRPHQARAEQARADRFAREVMAEMKRDQEREDARKAREKMKKKRREEVTRQAQAAREEAERVEVHYGHGDEVTNDLVREAIATNQDDEYPSWMSAETFDDEEGNEIDIDEATETEHHDDEELEGDDDGISNVFEEEKEEGQEQQPAGKPLAHSEDFNKAGQESKKENEAKLGGNARGSYLGALKDAIGSDGMMTTFCLIVPAPVLLFAGRLWSTDTGKMLATLAIYLVYVYVVYVHVPMVQALYPHHLPKDEVFTYQTFQVLAFMLLLHLCLQIALRRRCPTPPPLIPEKGEEEKGKNNISGVSIGAIVVKSEEEIGVQGRVGKGETDEHLIDSTGNWKGL